ncbi:MAG TPA: DoxX family protein [Chitinophagaceae bacterium]|nr:DoxX family protein [Chitinophagaceae bacterium]
MNSKIIHNTYYITLILFCGIISLTGFARLAVIPQAKEIIGQLGYPHYFPKYIGICSLIGIVSLWLMPLRFLKDFTYAGFFILLVSAIFSYVMKGDSWSFIFLPFVVLILLSVNYYCFYKTELKKQKHKYLMHVIHKKIKDNDVDGEMAHHYSDAG